MKNEKPKSTNFLLFEILLEKEGRSDLFESVRHISLRDIIVYINIYFAISSSDSVEMLNIARAHMGKPERMSILEADKYDFALLKSIKELHSLIQSDDIKVLGSVIDAIDEYHIKQNNE